MEAPWRPPARLRARVITRGRHSALRLPGVTVLALVNAYLQLSRGVDAAESSSSTSGASIVIALQLSRGVDAAESIAGHLVDIEDILPLQLSRGVDAAESAELRRRAPRRRAQLQLSRGVDAAESDGGGVHQAGDRARASIEPRR